MLWRSLSVLLWGPRATRNFPIIYNFVRQKNKPTKTAPMKPFVAVMHNKYLWIFIGLILISLLSSFIYFALQPFDATVFQTITRPV
jgi:uncharacterized membrane-anchored protein